MRTFGKLFFGLFLLLGGADAMQAHAQDPYEEISTLFHKRAGAFVCETVATSVAEIRKKSDTEIQSEIEQEIESTPAADSETRTRLLQLRRHPALKQKVIHGLEAICRAARKPVLSVGRTLGLTNAVVVNGVLTPINMTISFFKGLFDRRRETLERTDFAYRAFGPKNGVPLYLLGNLVSELPLLLLPSSAVFGIAGIPFSVEMITNYRCFHLNESNPDQVKFCRNYSAIKDGLHRANQKAFLGGKKLQTKRDQKKAERNASLSESDFCKFTPQAQMKRARLALQRNAVFNDSRVSYVEIMPPFHKNTCTKILIQTEKAADLESLQAEYPKVEGIQVVYLAKGEYPREFYYTAEELAKMPFGDQLCHDVMRVKYASRTTSKVNQINDLVKSTLAKSMLGSPETREVSVPNEMLRQGDVSHLRNVIFYIGLPESDLKRVEDLRTEQRELSSEIKDDYRVVMHSDSFQDCRERLPEMILPLEDFETKLSRLNVIASDRSLQTAEEQKAVEHFFKKKKRILKMDWKLVSTNDLETVSAALKSSDLGNVVILSHLKQGGYLSDSKQQEYPSEAFSVLSPSILSLNFYSCYSDKIFERYSLDQKMQGAPSYHKMRYLTAVKGNDFMDGDSYAPIAAFGDYLFQLDRFLNRSRKGSELLQKEYGSRFSPYTAPASCSADLSALKVEKGTYAVILNDHYVDTIAAGKSSSGISFPCEWLKAEKNSLKLKNVVNAGGSKISHPSSFSLTVGAQTVQQSSLTLETGSILIFKF